MMKNRLKKGFTIIELIVVIAVLGILVLLAFPKFLGYTEKAKVAQVKNDIVAYEKAIDSKRTDNDKYIESWEKVDTPTMESIKKSLFNKKGLINDSNNATFEGEYYKVPKDNKLVKTNLKGDFYLGQGGEVYYYDENLANKILGNENGGNDGENGEGDGQPPVTEPDTPKEPEPPVVDLPGPFKVTFKDYYGKIIETKTVEKGASVTPPVNPVTELKIDKWDKDLTNIQSDLEVKPVIDGPTDKDLGYSYSDFTWVEYIHGYNGLNRERGYFKYTGTGRSTVEIPHVIKGVPMTSYLKMFDRAPEKVTKIISTNKNITNMASMFYDSRATSLDLSSLDTSNVTNMSYMFYWAQAENLDLSSFDTSKVTDMNNMFGLSAATSITFGPNFNTSNVTNMSDMFNRSAAVTLDLSSFNTSNVTNMSNMFIGSAATSITFGPNFNTSNVTDMSNMFSSSRAESLDLSKLDTSNVANMRGMFSYSRAESLDLSKLDTSNVENMATMFSNSLTTSIIFGPNFNTSKVTDMRLMFSNSQARTLDLSSFDTSNVGSMSGMFSSSKATTGYARTQADANKFNTSYDKTAGLRFVVKTP